MTERSSLQEPRKENGKATSDLHAKYLALVKDLENGCLSGKSTKHPAFAQIVALGKPAIPWLLAEIQEGAVHWTSAALAQITGGHPDGGLSNPSEIRKAWIKWGKVNH